MATNQYNPDCGYAWIVVAACFIINFIMAGLSRAAGVLYIALIDVYGVSREVATTPFSIRFCIRNLSGPVVGALGQHFGIRPVVVLGGLICGLGGILSALSPDVTWIIAAWGGIHGLGYGMSNIIHTIVINQYFNKYKALAIGISLTGDCFGTFILPLLLEFLLPIYDLHGTFLILAGISLNVVPAALLLRSPSWKMEMEEPSSVFQDDDVCIYNSKKKCIQGIHNEGFDNSCENCFNKSQLNNAPCIIPTITINGYDNNRNCFRNQQGMDKVAKIQDSKKAWMEHIDLYLRDQNKNKFFNDTFFLGDVHSLKESKSLRVTDKNLKTKRFRTFFSLFNTHKRDRGTSALSVISCPCYMEKIALDVKFVSNNNGCQDNISNSCLDPPAYSTCESSEKQKSCSQCVRDVNTANNSNSNEETFQNQSIIPFDLLEDKFTELKLYEENTATEIKDLSKSNAKDDNKSSPIVNFLKTNVKPMLLIISVSMAFYVFLFISVFTIIIDYVADNDISKEYGKYLIIAFSITDIFGRIGFGIVLDKKLFALSHFSGVTIGLMGFLILIFPFYKCFIFWMISFSLCGFIQGGVAIMFPLLVEKYMEKDEESVALGSLNFYGGVLMLPIPSMIGFFRDNIGSYDGVFWTVGALCMFAASLWILEPCIVANKEKDIQKTAHEECNNI